MSDPAPASWPEVPSCHGWLHLTRRGDWRLGDPRSGKTGRVSHGGLLDFINRHYGPAEAGAWCVQNGPQKVYAGLDYTPWIWRLADHGLLAHTGTVAGAPSAAWLDEDGCLLLETPLGIGLLDDRDLPDVLARLVDREGVPLCEAALAALCAGPVPGAGLSWNGKHLPIAHVARADVSGYFGFNPSPAAP